MNHCSSNSSIRTNAAGNAQQDKTGVLTRCCVGMLRSYKQFISPLLPPSCRFTPTCSEYAMEAVQCHGVIRGLMLSILRLLRCHPFAKGGYDPVK